MTHGGKYVVTAVGQLEEIAIECVEVEVSPSTADLPIMSSTYQYYSGLSLALLQTSTLVEFWWKKEKHVYLWHCY